MDYNNDNNNNDNNNNYEEVCAVCRRTESVAGKMIEMQKGFCICKDCLQKSFDMINEMSQNGQLDDLSKMMQGMNLSDLSGIPGMPDIRKNEPKDETLPGNEEASDDKEEKKDDRKDDKKDEKKSSATPLFLNLGSIFGGQNPNLERTRIRKKERKEDDPPLIDIKKVPPPHKIKAMLDEYIIGQEQAKKIISDHMDVLHSAAGLLMEKEKLTGREFEALFEEKQTLPAEDIPVQL